MCFSAALTPPDFPEQALNLMCGSWGSDCNVQRWYDFLGSASNGFAPYDVYYHFETETEVTVTSNVGEEKTFYPLQLDANPCYEPYGNDSVSKKCLSCSFSSSQYVRTRQAAGLRFGP